ncbi:hypothetical protein B0H63DRAFT_556625 [Podospora didyma]|uniref:Uncharacterized protein n=1 Tax=Podospora didyma TaxID=330526 RepID=A0AAE0NXJ6_9PEZI|nr:hypothetical protein B0H63DRAFT_556625 [Podospora didyma]
MGEPFGEALTITDVSLSEKEGLPSIELSLVEALRLIRLPYVPGEKVYPRNDATIANHTMGTSLPRYLEIKVHQAVLDKRYDEIVVVGAYNRYSPGSIAFEGEKRDKPFNWERPTARAEGNTLYIECFPGYDHIEHYAEIIAGYLRILEEQHDTRDLTPSSCVSFVPSSCSDTLQALEHATNLSSFPGQGVDTVVLGQVWHLSNLTGSPVDWQGSGPWQWVLRTFASGRKVAFLGFRPAFWGDIAGEVVHWLASRLQVKEVIYLGKLGVLRKGVRPNTWLATGGRSLVNGRVVEWDNTLAMAVAQRGRDSTIFGSHVTLGSVLHETRSWHAQLADTVDFVDPEIGMMAQAAVRSGIRYGYLHMITDNLGQKYEEDLSNERTESVLTRRARLHQVVQDVMEEHLCRPL